MNYSHFSLWYVQYAIHDKCKEISSPLLSWLNTLSIFRRALAEWGFKQFYHGIKTLLYVFILSWRWRTFMHRSVFCPLEFSQHATKLVRNSKYVRFALVLWQIFSLKHTKRMSLYISCLIIIRVCQFSNESAEGGTCKAFSTKYEEK